MATPGMDPQHRVREDVRLHPIRLLQLPLVCRLAPAGIPDPARCRVPYHPWKGSSGTTATASNARNRRSPAHRQVAFSLPASGSAAGRRPARPLSHQHTSTRRDRTSAARAGGRDAPRPALGACSPRPPRPGRPPAPFTPGLHRCRPASVPTRPRGHGRTTAEQATTPGRGSERHAVPSGTTVGRSAGDPDPSRGRSRRSRTTSAAPSSHRPVRPTSTCRDVRHWRRGGEGSKFDL